MNGSHPSETFGPFSEPIDIPEFIESANKLANEGNNVWNNKHNPSQSWGSLPNAAQSAIERECQLDDIIEETTSILDNGAIYSHLVAERLEAINSLTREVEVDKKRKRKRLGEDMQIDTNVHPDVFEYHQHVEGASISWWKLPPEASSFIRRARQYEYNAFSAIKPYTPPQQESDSELHSQITQGGVSLLTISIFERTVTSPYAIHRTSTHVFLSTQTLGDLCNIMPCPSKEQPGEARDTDGNLTSYDLKTPDMTGCVVCVAGFAYGDGLEVDDYVDKLCQYLKDSAKDPAASGLPPIHLQRGSNIHAVQLSSLKLALHFPNWILHYGSCEHYFVLDQIRLLHPTDPRIGYPLTLHIAPPIRGKCRLCENLPAAFSLVNDLRMPDTPFLICKQCMSIVGTITNEDALVIPLIEYATW